MKQPAIWYISVVIDISYVPLQCEINGNLNTDESPSPQGEVKSVIRLPNISHYRGPCKVATTIFPACAVIHKQFCYLYNLIYQACQNLLNKILLKKCDTAFLNLQTVIFI